MRTTHDGWCGASSKLAVLLVAIGFSAISPAVNAQEPNGACYIDTSCSGASGRTFVRDSGSGQCVDYRQCEEVWKCAQGPITGDCGGGTMDCVLSPGCGSDMQDCFNGFCRSNATCNDLVKTEGTSFDPGPTQCSCAGIPPASGNFCATNSLAVGIRGIGGATGTVVSDPLGISCGSDCIESYPQSTLVSLTATPAPGSTFVRWGGSPECELGEIFLGDTHSCTAWFALEPAEPRWYDTYDFSSTGALAYWPFDGDSEDKTGNVVGGTWSGGAFIQARFDRGRPFTPDQFFSAPNSILQSFDEVTLAAWFRSTVAPSEGESILGVGFDGTFVPHAYLWATGPSRSVSMNASSATERTDAPSAGVDIHDGTWHHLGVTWDGNASRVYVDGGFRGERFSNAGTITPAAGQPIFINRHNCTTGSSSRISGEIDEAVIFGRALSEAEIEGLANDEDGDGTADFWLAESPPSPIVIEGPTTVTSFDGVIYNAIAEEGCDPDPFSWRWTVNSGFWSAPSIDSIDNPWQESPSPATDDSVAAMWLVANEASIEARNDACPNHVGRLEVNVQSQSPGGSELVGNVSSSLPTVVFTHGLGRRSDGAVNRPGFTGGSNP